MLLCLTMSLLPKQVVAQGGAHSPWQHHCGLRQSGPFSVGVDAGIMTHLGDIKMHRLAPDPSEVRYSGAFFVDYRIWDNYSLRLRLMDGRMAGIRGSQSFQTDLFETAAAGIIDLFPGLLGSGTHNFRLYALGGAGILFFDARLSVNDQPEDEASGSALVFFGGMGISYRTGQYLKIFMESSNRLTTSDQLDAFVSNLNDAYNVTSLGVSFHF